jgi:molybdate transport system substrate-binding protein
VKRAIAALLCAAVLPLAGCALESDLPTPLESGAESPRDSIGTSDGDLTGTLTVFAAASLTDVFTDFADELEAQNPSLDVVLVVGGSSALAQQLIAGAPADVFAAADETTMHLAVEGGVVDDPQPFARNLLALTVPAGNPGDVQGLADLARPELIVALCASEVPCGRATDQLLLEQGVTPSVDTREQDVRSVLTKIELGEVDAGLVYATDARVAAESVETVLITGAESVATTASIALVTARTQPEAATQFLALVTSAEGARILREAGFAAVVS